MKKPFLFLLLAGLLAGHFSCKKDPPPTNTNPPSPIDSRLLVARVVHEENGDETRYTHDLLNRCILEEAADYRSFYSYEPGLVRIWQVFLPGLDTSFTAFTLTNGLVTEATVTDAFSPDTYRLVYERGPDGQTHRRRLFQNEVPVNIRDFTYGSDGSLVLEEVSDPAGNGLSSISYSYSTTVENTIDRPNFGWHYWLRDSKRAPVQQTYFNASGSISGVANFEYEQDSEGRISKRTMKYTSSTFIDTATDHFFYKE